MTNHPIQSWEFLSSEGNFTLTDPQRTNYLYFPLVNEAGMMSVITPMLHGDAKTSQHAFLLPPVSVEDLHISRLNRNFWVFIDGYGAWSASGNSAAQIAAGEDKVTVEAGFLWHKVRRENTRLGIRAEITSLVPATPDTVELMKITLTNSGSHPIQITPTAAIPIYGRSADNLRDHRNVTSLLQRTRCEQYGVLVRPTLSFDERGHQPNHLTYAVFGAEGDGTAPTGFFPVLEDFIGEGGTFDWPEEILRPEIEPVQAGSTVDGYESLGGLRFRAVNLQPGESRTYILVMAILGDTDDPVKFIDAYATEAQFTSALVKTTSYWQTALSELSFHTGDTQFNAWSRWVTIQPMLRRLYGCSFMPYHDYGRGGRGWRDLWQDILALLLMEKGAVDGLLFGNFAGIRLDGSNATIIGSQPGEFKADRNNIPRVWMDHGAWPLMTTQLYIDQTGDLDFLLRQQIYFKDNHIHRCTAHDLDWVETQGTVQRAQDDSVYQGTILEHLLAQHLVVFFNVGDHNNILLEGADWNDGMDMARKQGEGVAFTAFYANNLSKLSRLAFELQARGVLEIELAVELLPLLDTLHQPVDYASPAAKKALLAEYFHTIEHTLSGRKICIATSRLVTDLQVKSEWLMEHLRKNEWVQTAEGYSFFNGYYDNDGKKLEGDHPNGVRMTLTGQVFPLMGHVATDEQARQIVRAADRYLYAPELHGYRLNTDIGEVKLNMGRCFGYAYGHKENGAMFSHMAVMYAYALYERGFVNEGFRVLEGIYRQSVNFPSSRMYPGIPEYFNNRGRGMYPYLTGSASWYLLTLVTRAFGVYGKLGDLVLNPKLVRDQFGADGEAGVTILFAGRKLEITYHNPSRLGFGSYRVGSIILDGQAVDSTLRDGVTRIPLSTIARLDDAHTHRLMIELIQV
jgi:cellobiose phosphorylase